MATIRVQDRLTLAAMLSAVSCSRMFVKLTLTKWGAVRILDDALLIVSELVTNAVKATGITDPEPNWSALQQLNIVTVRIVGLEDSIVFEVWDASPEEPTVKEAALDDEGGRGLDLVEHLAKRWGSYPHRGGKVVWAELPVHTTTPGGLPRRRRSSGSKQQPAGEEEPPVPDPKLLKRVLVGLQAL